MTGHALRPRPVIVHVTGWISQQYGSFERQMVVLASRLRRADGALHLVLQQQPASAAFMADIDASVHVLAPAQGPADISYVRRCAALLRRVGATHLHAHHGTDAYLAVAAARLAHVPRRFVTRHTSPGRSRVTAARLRHRVLAHEVERVFAVSQHVADELVDLGVPDTLVRVNLMGADTRRYRPDAARRAATRRALGVDDDTHLVLATSHLRPGKGVERMPDLAAALARDPGRCLTVVAGGGPRAGAVTVRAAQLGLGPGTFRLLGVRDDVPALLSAADVFVLPTDGTEGLPAGVIEALASATPVVVTDVAGMGTLVGDVAHVVPGGRTAALVDAVRDVLAAPSPSASADGRTLVRRRFSVEAGVEQLLSTYLDDADTRVRPR